MSDLSITELLEAYGAWVNDDNNDLGCKSPVSYTHLTLPTKRIV